MIQIRKSIRFKLGAGISVLVVVLSLLGDVFLYRYTQDLLMEQHKRLILQDLDRCAESISVLGDEVQMIAKGIAVDSQIQNFYRTEDPDYYQTENAMLRTAEHIAIRLYLTSAALVCDRDGKREVYWTENPYEPYFAEQMEESWYRSMEDENRVFSEIHIVGVNKRAKVITYRYEIRDSLDPARRLGEVLLNIDVEKFSSELSQLTEPYQTFFIYDRNTEQAVMERGTIDAEGAYEAAGGSDGMWIPYQDGVLARSPIENLNWEICLFTSNQELRDKLVPLLYFFVCYALLSIFAIVLCVSLFAGHCTKPIPAISSALLKFAEGRQDIRLDIRTEDELEILGEQFNAMADSIQQYIEQVVAAERTKKKIRFDMLMSKIHPHFLYNTLNSVIHLARRSGDRDIEEMVKALITILQDGMAAYTGKTGATLEEELAIIRSYVTIQSYRYKDCFTVSYHIPEYLLQAYLPKNILQPIVENAVYHGIVPKHEFGTVEIWAEEEDRKLRIMIADDGVGMDETQTERLMSGAAPLSGAVHSIGMSNLKDRLDYFYRDQYCFEIYSECGKGTTVIIQLPLSYEPMKEMLEENWEEREL